MTESFFVFFFLVQQYLFFSKEFETSHLRLCLFLFFYFRISIFLMRGLVDNCGLGISNDHIFLLQSTRERIRDPTDLFLSVKKTLPNFSELTRCPH